jgi:transcriptional regulator with XRE-family HTH domain
MQSKREAIGHRIRMARQAMGLTQEELAAKMQLAGHSSIIQTAQSKIESGDRDVSLLEAISYAEILHVPLWMIAYGKRQS